MKIFIKGKNSVMTVDSNIFFVAISILWLKQISR
jgi:hypothetical protein